MLPEKRIAKAPGSAAMGGTFAGAMSGTGLPERGVVATTWLGAAPSRFWSARPKVGEVETGS